MTTFLQNTASTLLERDFPRTTRSLVDEYATGEYEGYSLDAWVFDDRQERQWAENTLKKAGLKAHVRSAYKPLVHFFIEEFTWNDLSSLTIEYPTLDNAPQRFLLEAYPLSAMLPDGVTLHWIAIETSTPYYRVKATRASGTDDIHVVAAPNRHHTDHVGQAQCSPCGWLQLTSPDGTVEQREVLTDYEALFQSAIRVISQHPWGAHAPYFDTLKFTVHLPCHDQRLNWGDEHISLAEALHEDLYFSVLEYFQHYAGLPLGDRSIQPGQIVPEVLTKGSAPYLGITLEPLTLADPSRERVSLDTAQSALGVEQLTEILDALGGQPLEAQTRAGRRVNARYIEGSDRPVIISAGQHANEPSGIVGALRAGTALSQRPGAHFVLSPLENPDGYALQGHLVASQPRHMHHAARYTAFGNDLQNQPLGEPFELAIREQAVATSGPALHVNLHGYPAHEWTRPLTGYVPRGFDMWTIPKGFFLIVRHRAGMQNAAEQLIEAVTRSLSKVPGLVDFNATQVAHFEAHAGSLTFPMRHGFPYLLAEDDDQLTPLMLITEYPDETLSGHAFVQAHTAQMETVLSAYTAYQDLRFE
ncbi:peptidase M14 [Halomonas sp. H10-9-1]|uniref:peptidase M14 n=1 Tax=Halomonas sp. H10-9-1 TaxID=2950871 RepID=UPI0032DEA64C